MNELSKRRKDRLKSHDTLVQQTKDFLTDCDEDSYIYARLYSAKKLMRALDNPYYRDICWQLKKFFINVMQSDIIDWSMPSIDRHNIQEMEQRISQELTEQALSFSWAESAKSIATLNMKVIRKEHVAFLREQKRQEVEISWRSENKDQIVINPYEYLHNTH